MTPEGHNVEGAFSTTVLCYARLSQCNTCYHCQNGYQPARLVHLLTATAGPWLCPPHNREQWASRSAGRKQVTLLARGKHMRVAQTHSIRNVHAPIFARSVQYVQKNQLMSQRDRLRHFAAAAERDWDDRAVLRALARRLTATSSAMSTA